MRFGKYLSSLTKPELEELKEKCNFTEEDSIIFNMLSKNCSLLEIRMESQISRSTLRRRINVIKEKVDRLNGKSD